MGSTPGLTQGEVPTAAQWNSFFGAKQDDLGFIPLSAGGGTLTGQVTVAASTTSLAGVNFPPGTSPSSPNNGDLWTTATGLFVRLSGVTISLTGGAITGFAGGTLTAPLTTAPSALSGAGLNVAPGAVPSSPNNGDLWVTSSGLFSQINGSSLNVSQPAQLHSLTLKASPLQSDELLLYDTAAGSLKKALVSAMGLPNVLQSNVTANISKGYTITPQGQGTILSGTFTPDPTQANYQFFTNGGSFTFATPSSDCAIDFLITNNASAGTITFSGYTVGANTGDALTTTNGNQFIVSIRRINSVATYVIKALQ